MALATRLPKPEHWLICFKRDVQAKLRLFCFPYAGADANIYRDWAAHMPDGVELYGVQYPGRGVNGGPPLMTCRALVEQLHPHIAPLLDRQFVCFGHSTGALVSFEMARRLRAAEKSRHVHHFFSARTAPHVPPETMRIHTLPRDEFVEEIRKMGGTPQQVLAAPRLLNLLLPRLRADFTLTETYAYEAGAILDCPISLLHGTADQTVRWEAVERWSDMTTASCAHHTLDAGHFFLHTHKSEVLTIVRARLSQLLSRLPDGETAYAKPV
ncbi:MAG: hypothetical protein RL701_1249 [Pseudomonadota bacterium]|jgi:medium-chain acyl-[acyl-carrier-protein] hydrolase